jgi:hypothetical protein
VRAQDERANELQQIAATLMPETAEAHRSWLTIASVPDTPGALELRRGRTDEWREWLHVAIAEFPCFGPRQVNYATSGFRSIDYSDAQEMQSAYYSSGGRLFLDGSGVIVFAYMGGAGASA